MVLQHRFGNLAHVIDRLTVLDQKRLKTVKNFKNGQKRQKRSKTFKKNNFLSSRSSRHSSTSSLTDKSASALAEVALNLDLRLSGAILSSSGEKMETPAPFPVSSQIGTGGLSRLIFFLITELRLKDNESIFLGFLKEVLL